MEGRESSGSTSQLHFQASRSLELAQPEERIWKRGRACLSNREYSKERGNKSLYNPWRPRLINAFRLSRISALAMTSDEIIIQYSRDERFHAIIDEKTVVNADFKLVLIHIRRQILINRVTAFTGSISNRVMDVVALHTLNLVLPHPLTTS